MSLSLDSSRGQRSNTFFFLVPYFFPNLGSSSEIGYLKKIRELENLMNSKVTYINVLSSAFCCCCVVVGQSLFLIFYVYVCLCVWVGGGDLDE